MKLHLLLVFIFILSLSTWLPKFINSLTNQNSQIAGYVQETGLSLKNLYVQNVQNKITSYLGIYKQNSNTNNVIEVEDQALRIKRILSNPDEAQVTVDNIYDTIDPEVKHYKFESDDPTVSFTTPQLIASHGYSCESHTIVTDDGYILTIHRIPYNKNGTAKTIPQKTVLLHHGILGSSADWIIPGPEKGLGYILSEAGYDVWLANVRGNTYSRAHVSRTIDSFEFWNFTFHDVSQHDLPAVIDYIMEVKGGDVKVNYIGHSMGTTVLFALLSTKTQYNKILRAGYALAPVAYMSKIKSPIRLLARFGNNIEYLMKLLGENEFMPQNALLRWFSKYFCDLNHYEEKLCENSLFLVYGYDERQFNTSLIPLIQSHNPAGTSTRTIVHYAQEIQNDGRFQQFDYGKEGNIKQYGTITPPEYPVQNITLPIALFSAENDWLSSDVDATNLYTQLVNPIEHYIVPMKEFNHIDFLWAVDAPTLVYKKLLQLMEDGVSKR